MLGQGMLGISPASLALTFRDWLMHFALAPGKQRELLDKALRKLHRFALYAAHAAHGPAPAGIEPLPQDTRFTHADWQRWLAAHSGKRTALPAMGAPARGYVPLADAPGAYVLSGWAQ